MRAFKVPLMRMHLDLDSVVSIDEPILVIPMGTTPFVVVRYRCGGDVKHQELKFCAEPSEFTWKKDGRYDYEEPIEDGEGVELVVKRVTAQVFEPLMAAWRAR